MDVKENPILNVLDLSTTEDNFSEDLKLESSGLETGDIANVSSGTTEKDACGACPLVLSGIVFSRDANTPIRDINSLGVVCDTTSMS